MTIAVISLGSNLGFAGAAGVAGTPGADLRDPERLLRLALQELQALSALPLTTSSFYRTAPIDCPPGAQDFINAIALLRVARELTADKLLEHLHLIETRFGRQRDGIRNQPRTLDLDLISFGALQCAGPRLILPHPRAHQRLFVMAPLAEVAPDLKLPGQALTAAQLARQLQGGQQVAALASNTNKM